MKPGEILMLAWMNREALQKTVELGQAVYFSRSRQRLWHKGEESGHFQQVHEMRLDCDHDVLLLQEAVLSTPVRNVLERAGIVRADVLVAKDDSVLKRMPWARYAEPGGADYKRWKALQTHNV